MLLLLAPSCSGPKLGGVVERSAFAGEQRKATGLTYVRSLHIAFPGTGVAAKPSDVLALPSEELVVVDGDRGRAAIFDRNGAFLAYLEAPGAFSPLAAALGPGLSIYLLDSYGGSICRYDATGQLAGVTNEDRGSSFVDLCFDKTGAAYLSDHVEDKVHVRHGEAWSGAGLGGFGSGSGMFIDPSGLDVDERDLLYVCDTGNSRIQVMDQWGAVTAVVPLREDGCRPRPRSIAVDRWGNLFVTDAGCECLRILGADGAETFCLKGEGPGLSFTESPGGLDEMDERLYVADAVAGAIQVFDIRYEL
jgi:hypothetical protein